MYDMYVQNTLWKISKYIYQSYEKWGLHYGKDIHLPQAYARSAPSLDVSEDPDLYSGDKPAMHASTTWEEAVLQ